MSAKDRLIAVANSASFNGVDFIDVASPTELVVHFLNSVPINTPAPTATIAGGDSITDIALKPVQSGDWGTDSNGRILLHLHALATGDFSLYTLTLAGPQIDLILGTSTFSFKAFCPSVFDCAPPPAECPPSDLAPPPIDYLSRDFQSFQQALLAYSSLRYPNWVERSASRFRLDDVRDSVGRWRRIELFAGSRRGRIQPHDGDAATLAHVACPSRRLRTLAALQRLHLACVHGLGEWIDSGQRAAHSDVAERRVDPVRDRPRYRRRDPISRRASAELSAARLLVRRQRGLSGGGRDQHVGARPQSRLPGRRARS